MLQDIATLTGGTVISSDLGYELKDATMQLLGRPPGQGHQGEHHHRRRCRGDKQAIADRVAQIRSQIAVAPLTSTVRSCRSASAKMAWRCSHQGWRATEVEMKDKKLRTRMP